MNLIIPPSLIAIDTSILGKVTDDYFSAISTKRKKAKQFVKTIADKGLVPLFCMHHFQEIMQHENDLKVSNRLKFIKKLPQIAWIKPSSSDALVGSIIDIQGVEILKIIEQPQLSLNELTSEIKTQIVEYSTGQYLINNIEEALFALRELGTFDTQKSKEIASITHISDPQINNLKLSELHKSQLKSPDEVKQSMEALRANLIAGISTRGDAKLNNLNGTVDSFVKQVFEEGSKMFNSESSSLYTKFITSHGIEEHEVDESMTVGDFGYYAIFRKKIKVLSRSYNFDFKKALQIPPESFPSWFIWVEADKKMKEEKYAAGSNIIDKYLASLAFYSDFLVVDKRLKEYISQICRKNKKFSFINSRVIKLPDYDNLALQLST